MKEALSHFLFQRNRSIPLQDIFCSISNPVLRILIYLIFTWFVHLLDCLYSDHLCRCLWDVLSLVFFINLQFFVLYTYQKKSSLLGLFSIIWLLHFTFLICVRWFHPECYLSCSLLCKRAFPNNFLPYL